MQRLIHLKNPKKTVLRTIILGSLFIGAIYFAAAGALFYFLKYHRDQSYIQFSEILLLPLPGRWAAYEAKQGQALIKTAIDLLNSGEVKRAAHALHVGLAKDPGNRDGRLLLAQLQMNLQRPDLAEGTLIRGLQHHSRDLLYLGTVLEVLFTQQRDNQAYALCSDLLSQPSTPPQVIQLAALGAATACHNRGDYQQAENLLLRYNLLTQKEGRLLAAKIQWDLGYRALALHQLQTLAQELPQDEAIYRQLITYLREDSRFDEARQLDLVFQVAQPNSAQPRINLLRDSLRKLPDAAWQQEAAATLRYFAHDPQALLALAEMAATEGQPDLARQVQDHFPPARPETDAAALLTIEALLNAKNYPSALAAADEFAKRTPPPAAHLLNICSGLQAIAHFGNKEPEAGRLSLSAFLASRNLRATHLTMVANRLIELGHRPAAREVLVRAVANDPSNQAALTRLIEVDLADGHAENLPAAVQRLLTLRKPSRTVLAQAQRQMGSDRFIFSREHGAVLAALTAYLSAPPPAVLHRGAN